MATPPDRLGYIGAPAPDFGMIQLKRILLIREVASLNMTPDNDLTRRDFVKTAGAVTAVAATIGAPAIQKVRAANDRVQYGIIGTGSRGNYLMKHLKDIDSGQCVLGGSGLLRLRGLGLGGLLGGCGGSVVGENDNGRAQERQAKHQSHQSLHFVRFSLKGLDEFSRPGSIIAAPT